MRLGECVGNQDRSRQSKPAPHGSVAGAQWDGRLWLTPALRGWLRLRVLPLAIAVFEHCVHRRGNQAIGPGARRGGWVGLSVRHLWSTEGTISSTRRCQSEGMTNLLNGCLGGEERWQHGHLFLIDDQCNARGNCLNCNDASDEMAEETAEVNYTRLPYGTLVDCDSFRKC